MEPAQLQLVFNVVAITGVSSLASYCYLLKKENRKLATGLQGERTHEQPGSTVIEAPKADSPTEMDIRAFAADQRARWVDGMRLSATLWSERSR